MGLLLLFISGYVFADVSGNVLEYNKITVDGKPMIEVSIEFTYPDETKKIGKVNYNCRTFSREKVIKDVNSHCETIVKYYIEGQSDIMLDKETELIDEYIKIKHLPITVTLESVYLEEIDLTIQADGTIKEIYQ